MFLRKRSFLPTVSTGFAFRSKVFRSDIGISGCRSNPLTFCFFVCSHLGTSGAVSCSGISLLDLSVRASIVSSLLPIKSGIGSAYSMSISAYSGVPKSISSV